MPPEPPAPSVVVEAAPPTRLHDLAGASLAIARAQDLDELLRATTEAAREVIGTHQAVTSRLVDGWVDARTYVALSDRYARYRAYDVVPKGLGVLNAVTRENRPLRLDGPQLARHPEFRGLADAPGHPPLPDYLAAPLVSREGRNLGLVQLSDKVDGTPFTEEDELLLVQLAQLASAAVDHVEALDRERSARAELEAEQAVVAGLAARIERRAAQLHRLAEAATAMNRAPTLEAVLQLATEEARALLDAHQAVSSLTSGDDWAQAITAVSMSERYRPWAGYDVPPDGSGIYAWALERGRPVRMTQAELEAHPRWRGFGAHAPDHPPMHGWLAVPLSAHDGAPLGLLQVSDKRVGEFDAEDEAILVQLGEVAASAIHKTRLYEERARVADVLQRSLLPAALPTSPRFDVAARYQAGAEQVGGDFYDVFPCGDGCWALAIGDVCGRGPEAAAVTALARHTIRTASSFRDDPGEVLSILNDALCGDADERFLSAFHARLRFDDDGGAEMLHASAGHPPALVVRADGRVDALAPTGPIVGLWPGTGVGSAATRLRPGDAIVLYTDGVVEARRGKEELGERRLVERLRELRSGDVDDLAGGVVELVRGFQDHAAGDDAAVLVLRLTGAVGAHDGAAAAVGGEALAG